MKKLFFLQFFLLFSFLLLETIFPMHKGKQTKTKKQTQSHIERDTPKSKGSVQSVRQKTTKPELKYGQRDNELLPKDSPVYGKRYDEPTGTTKTEEEVRGSVLKADTSKKESSVGKIKSFVEGLKQKRINRQIEKLEKRINSIDDQIEKSGIAISNKIVLQQKIKNNEEMLSEKQNLLKEINSDTKELLKIKKIHVKTGSEQAKEEEQNLKNEIDQAQKEIDDAQNQLRDELSPKQLNYLKQQKFKLETKLLGLKGEEERDKDRETQVEVAKASNPEGSSGEKGGFITGVKDTVTDHAKEIIGGAITTAVVGLTAGAGGGGIAGIAAATSDDKEGGEGGAEYEEYIDDIEVDIGVYETVPRLRKKISSGLAAGTSYLNDDDEE